MKVLVIGSGGREHALVWKINQSRKVKKIYAAPGNGGTHSMAEPIGIKADDIKALLDFAKKEKIDLTVVGPEAPLVAGIVDLFEKAGLRIFGPGKECALLEGSKVFAKELMKEWNVPTADFEVFTSKEKAEAYVNSKNRPLVVKADGLAAGKGVYICKTKADALQAIDDIMGRKIFGDSGKRIIIEECLEGEEASIIVISDGDNISPMASSQDHKRIFDGDKGPNTGGMGAYSPAPVAEGSVFKNTLDHVIYPMINGMKKRGTSYKGVLYAGIMITKKGPYVLEFNVRFGDPETQAILPRMKSDIVDLMEASIDGRIKDVPNEWEERSCVCIVVSSGGYPGKYEKGKHIKGLKNAEMLKDVVVFHAGTAISDGNVVTSGGRVLGVTALGKDIKGAIKRSYEAAEKIDFDGIYYRKDIGKKAFKDNGCTPCGCAVC